ncbi:MAG: hypothetical protein JXA09_16405 [Anaerolineae bacterium]|nr:hypothetical protein [Anaerolineae bacterium]
METLTPAQRVLVTIIVLALTILAAALILPWLSAQIDLRLMVTATPGPPAEIPTPTPTSVPVSHGPWLVHLDAGGPPSS